MDRVLSSRIVFSVASTLAMRLIGTLVGSLDSLLSGTGDRSQPYFLRLLLPPFPLSHLYSLLHILIVVIQMLLFPQTRSFNCFCYMGKFSCCR
ncbi:hypothetical protein ARMGADRAFT_625559 [Armillaria gallica]|uniref:Uncharacterized protein n=1 Tax=Armillaria gallica TaxID=47427 RepID=A0A2H3E9B0_ARMGA|nr:hypothetical protein ARMGADRAFT_625559 [Armillaria gallica]